MDIKTFTSIKSTGLCSTTVYLNVDSSVINNDALITWYYPCNDFMRQKKSSNRYLRIGPKYLLHHFSIHRRSCMWDVGNEEQCCSAIWMRREIKGPRRLSKIEWVIEMYFFSLILPMMDESFVFQLLDATIINWALNM